MAAIAVEAGAEQIPVGELARLADSITNQLLTGKLSRDKENEADTKGLELAAAAGYDPRAFPEFLGYLGQASEESGNKQAVGNLTASHPKFSDRVKRLNEQIGKRGWDQEERPRLAERFQENVVFPETPAEPAPAPSGQE
jgi:predicted Zn-dependent protease